MTDTAKLEHKREQARIRKQNQRARERQGSGAQGSGIKVPGLAVSSQLISTAAQGALGSSFNDLVFRKVDGNFYEILREGIPIFDAAIRRLISLNGTIKIIGDNAALVSELEDFCLNVPVNDMQKGIVAFSQNAQNETFEQGFAIPEFIATKKRDDIDRLVVADSKNIFFRRNKDGRSEPWFRSGLPKKSNYTMPASVMQQIIDARYGASVSSNGVTETRLSPDNKLYFSIDNENQDPHGVSLFRSTEFCAQTLVTIQNSMKNVSERYGDPIHHVHYESSAKAGDLETRRKLIEDDFNKVITAKRQGKSGDIVTAGTTGAKVTITVVGHDGQVLTFETPLRHLLEQCISKFNLPAWMLGIYWSTTERMATLEVEMALADAKIRQAAMLPEYIRLFSNFLTLRGRTWKSVTTSLDKKGDWGMIFESPNVRDTVAMAQSEFLLAQASQMRTYGGQPSTNIQNAATQVPVGAASFEIDGMKFEVVTTAERGELRAESGERRVQSKCSCGKRHADTKELNRPAPWPRLDAVETGYEARLKADWKDLEHKIFKICNLPEAPKTAIANRKEADEAFSFTDDQRRQIEAALKSHLDGYALDDPNGPIRWYYGQAYTLGLVAAAEADAGAGAQPLLNLLKNREIYDKLVSAGFELVKNDATIALQDQIIAAMEQGMADGVSPIDVARTLRDKFGAANADWERLARTEMGGAAQKAKKEEWSARGVDVSHFINGPADLHPRCKCDSIVEEINGQRIAVLWVAPDACEEICQAAARDQWKEINAGADAPG